MKLFKMKCICGKEEEVLDKPNFDFFLCSAKCKTSWKNAFKLNKKFQKKKVKELKKLINDYDSYFDGQLCISVKDVYKHINKVFK